MEVKWEKICSFDPKICLDYDNPRPEIDQNPDIKKAILPSICEMIHILVDIGLLIVCCY